MLNRRWPQVAAIGVLLGFGTWMTHHAATVSSDARPGTPSESSRGDGHYVTAGQLVQLADRHDNALAPFALDDHQGRPFAWAAGSSPRPLAVLFVKAGCPCSVRYEDFFRRLHDEYRQHVDFVAILDGEVAAARTIAAEGSIPYPVLADVGGEVIRAWGAENGLAVVLATGDGSSAGSWPGWSQEMFVELNQRLAQAAGVDARPVDTHGLTGALITGCPFATRP